MSEACFDEPKGILESDTCITSLSKTLVEVKLDPKNVGRHVCKGSDCVTVRTQASLHFQLLPNPHCDVGLAQLASGQFVIDLFATAMEAAGRERGVHAGDFVWTTAAGDQIIGRMSGITNAGLVRNPLPHPIEDCLAKGVLTGRLCGEVALPKRGPLKEPRLAGARIVAIYRILLLPEKPVGTLEGVLVTPCTPRK